MMPTEEQLRTLRHMLGINTPNARFPEPTRDYYCANHSDEDLKQMERDGLVEVYRHDRSYTFYRTTQRGRDLATTSHKAIRHSKAKRMYHRFLDASDAISDLTFKKFLTDPYFAQARREA